MNFKDKISVLPNSPGVYRFFDSNDVIIYIGKAKDLKKRVSQYFVNPQRLTVKTRILVSKISNIEHTVVESEQDALLLENNLIKQYQPRYNIMLKDSKSYPWICIKNEPFPRVFITRRFVKDGSTYYGPYGSVQHAHHLIDLINSLYQLRTCNLSLTKNAIAENKFKPCLNIHIKKCEGPCIGKILEEEYNCQIDSIKNILKGDTNELIRDYKNKMLKCSSVLEFEKANLYKEKMEVLQNHYSKSLIVHPSISNVDVFSIVFDKYSAFGNFFRLNNGCIIQTLNLEFKLNIEEEESEVLTRFMIEVYKILEESIQDGRMVKGNNINSTIEEVLVPFLPNDLSLGKNIHIPLKGDKLSLLELSIKNANAFKFQKLKQEEIKNPEEGKNRSIIALKEDLHLNRLPLHIECFDNSNTLGTNPVAACVVFKNGKPSKKDYRHFNIKTVVGANDYASMYEVVHRRYSRLLSEGKELPQLVLIDGGKGQLSFAYNALVDLEINNKIEIVSIAERLEEIITLNDTTSLFLNKNSPSLKLLMHLRDEAHRFGITHHRNKRTKAQIDSALREIEGIGEATEKKLLQHFKSVKRLKEAPFADIVTLVGVKTAKSIFKHFNLIIS
ncbi:MAG: excinuclease ABC subunit UvrC [Bacteroidales bacterium]